MLTCDHKNIGFFCNEGCWESVGLNGRLLEMHMKNIKCNHLNLLKNNITMDVHDFSRFSIFLEEHSEWKERLNEMYKYGDRWIKLIDNYDYYFSLLNEGKLYYLYYLLNKKHISSKIYIPTDSIYNNSYIGGYLISPFYDDTCDIYLSCILKYFPNVSCNIYENKQIIGKINVENFDKTRFDEISHLDNFDETCKFIQNEEIKIVHSKMEEYAKTNDFYTSYYDYIDHYLLPYNNEEINKDEIYYAMIYLYDELIGSFLISLPSSHPLHPSNKCDYEIEFDNVKWVVSSMIEFNKFYDEGVINN